MERASLEINDGASFRINYRIKAKGLLIEENSHSIN